MSGSDSVSGYCASAVSTGSFDGSLSLPEAKTGSLAAVSWVADEFVAASLLATASPILASRRLQEGKSANVVVIMRKNNTALRNLFMVHSPKENSLPPQYVSAKLPHCLP
jgi:hypothetical protein